MELEPLYIRRLQTLLNQIRDRRDVLSTAEGLKMFVVQTRQFKCVEAVGCIKFYDITAHHQPKNPRRRR